MEQVLPRLFTAQSLSAGLPPKMTSTCLSVSRHGRQVLVIGTHLVAVQTTISHCTCCAVLCCAAVWEVFTAQPAFRHLHYGKHHKGTITYSNSPTHVLHCTALHCTALHCTACKLTVHSQASAPCKADMLCPAAPGNPPQSADSALVVSCCAQANSSSALCSRTCGQTYQRICPETTAC
jgi:hypothetical protein